MPKSVTTISSITKQKKETHIATKLFSFFLGILITFGALFALLMSGILNPYIEKFIGKNDDNAEIQFVWKYPSSTKQGYPEYTPGKNTLKIYDIATDNLKDTNIAISCCGGAMYLGETDPLPSPDLLYTAYIDANSKDLWILSNETFEKVRVPNSDNVTYITGWSPKGNTLVYYFTPETLATKKDGMMIEWDTVEKFDENISSGFYALNTETGETKSLRPVQLIATVISDDEVLAKTEESSPRMVIFDYKNYFADYASSKGEFGFGVGQFDISENGITWVFSGSQNPTEDMYITLAELPQKTGTIIDTGNWADVQWPKVSKNGKKVVYQKFTDNRQKPELWLYTKSEDAIAKPEMIGEGRPLAWVDDSNIIVEQIINIDTAVLPQKGIFNIDTKEFIPFE